MITTDSELEFKHWMRGAWQGWIDHIEPARGGSPGFPDCVVWAKKIGMVPIELKMGTIEMASLVKYIIPKHIRPVQIEWHRRYREAGGTSIMLVGIFGPPSDHLDMKVYATTSSLIRNEPIVFGRVALVYDSENNMDFTRYVTNFIMLHAA